MIPRLTRESFPEAPEWFVRFLDLLAPVLRAVERATGATPRQFEKMTITTASVLANTFSGSAVTFKNRLGVKPQKVALAQVLPDPMPVSFAGVAAYGPPIWELTSAGMIAIRYIAGLSVSTKYQLTFEVE